MKTKNIFSTLTLPVAMVLGMMTASCGNEDNIINEQPQQPTAAGYEIPATINASSPDGTVGYYKDGTETERLAIVASLTVNSTTYKYAIATANETSGTPTWTVDGVAYYTFADAKSQFANNTDSYSAANVWRLPTQTELEALAGLTNSWQADPAGRTWTIGSASLFLPAAGLCNSGDADDVGDYGYYWSSTPFDELLAYYLDFGSGYCDVYDDSREAGSSVRLFCKLPSE